MALAQNDHDRGSASPPESGRCTRMEFFLMPRRPRSNMQRKLSNQWIGDLGFALNGNEIRALVASF